MAIASLDQYIASAKQKLSIIKTASMTALTATRISPFALAGSPGAGVLAGTSTTTGVVPTDATVGVPILDAFGGGATGYLTKVAYGSTVACRLFLSDLLWKAGAYAFNASTTGQTPTSFAGRVPDLDYKGLEIWIEQVTVGIGIQSVNITYINQDGTAGRTGGTQSGVVAGTVGRCWQYTLQAGDTGVQGITGVVGSVATVGTFNVLVLRPLWNGRVRTANDGDIHGLDLTGMPRVLADSALYLQVAPDSTATGLPDLYLEIANA